MRIGSGFLVCDDDGECEDDDDDDGEDESEKKFFTSTDSQSKTPLLQPTGS